MVYWGRVRQFQAGFTTCKSDARRLAIRESGVCVASKTKGPVICSGLVDLRSFLKNRLPGTKKGRSGRRDAANVYPAAGAFRPAVFDNGQEHLT